MAGRKKQKGDAKPKQSCKFAGIGVDGGHQENCGAVTFSLGDRSDHRGAGAPTGKDGGEMHLNALSRVMIKYLHFQGICFLNS